MSKLVSANNAAEMLGISRRTLLTRIAQGKVTPVHKMDGLTGAYLFDADEIDRLARLEARKPAGTHR